jgi:sialidase-1
MKRNRICKVILALLSSLPVIAQDRQYVEGFDTVVFHYNANRMAASRDYRGTTRGFMTAGWWAKGQMKKNFLSWKTALVPAAKPTTFSFIAASSVLPSSITRGPLVKLSVNGQYALTFQIGYNRNFTWTEGAYSLKYISKRTEYPYFGSHRQLELNGNSGVYELSVPASAVKVNQPVTIEVEIQPFEQWDKGWFMVKDYHDVLQQSMQSLQAEVESMRQDMAVLNMQTHILATQQYHELLDTTKYEHHVIYSNGFYHDHPADLIKLRNGELLMMTREASEHYSNDGDVVMLRSKDNGLTWEGRQTIASLPADEREGCGVQLKDGTIVVGFFYNNNYNADGTYGAFYNWEKQKNESAPRDTSHPVLGAYIRTSTDNGRTWSKPNYINTKGMPFKNLEGPTDAPIEMPDGSIIMGVIGYSPNGNTGNRAAVLLRSTDKGKTWTYLSTMAGDPDGKLGGFLEPGIVLTKTGRIVTALRNHGPDQAIYTTYSDDNGRTWAAVQKTAMIGHPVDLIQLKDGRLMASYGIRTGPHTKPGGIRVCFSKDNGVTWDITTEKQLRNDFLNWDAGYPESLQLPNGRILTVYYYNLFGKYYIGGTFWKP